MTSSLPEEQPMLEQPMLENAFIDDDTPPGIVCEDDECGLPSD